MIKDKVLEGLPLDDVFIFDVHGHIDPDPRFFTPNCDGAGVYDTLDKLGINGICVSSVMAFDSDVNLGNETVLKATEDFKGRIYGYFLPNPYRECYPEKYLTGKNGILGVKIHANGNRTVIDNPAYYPSYEIADALGMPVLIHTWSDGEVRLVQKLAKEFKNANFIIAHSAMLVPYRNSCVEACKSADNIYVDTALSSSCEGTVEYIVDKVGADKVLYGSDLTFFDCRQTVGKIGLANISEEDKIKIYGLNAKRLFKGI